MSEFTQEEPRLGNQYDDDGLLRAYLRWRLPAKMRAQIDPELRRLGHRVITDIFALGEAAEASPPRHAPFDAWGRRVDRIETSDAWRQLDGISASEAIVATAYERANGPLSRIDQFARLYLFAPSSALYSCPLAMTDGAARFLEVHGDDSTRPVFAHLTSRDPEEFWTSGQWMTERTGGSDVGSTSTIAKCEAGNDYRLYGSKWFTSATTSQVAMTLARQAPQLRLPFWLRRQTSKKDLTKRFREPRTGPTCSVRFISSASLRPRARSGAVADVVSR